MKQMHKGNRGDPGWGLLLQTENLILGGLLLIMTIAFGLRAWLF